MGFWRDLFCDPDTELFPIEGVTQGSSTPRPESTTQDSHRQFCVRVYSGPGEDWVLFNNVQEVFVEDGVLMLKWWRERTDWAWSHPLIMGGERAIEGRWFHYVVPVDESSQSFAPGAWHTYTVDEEGAPDAQTQDR